MPRTRKQCELCEQTPSPKCKTKKTKLAKNSPVSKVNKDGHQSKNSTKHKLNEDIPTSSQSKFARKFDNKNLKSPHAAQNREDSLSKAAVSVNFVDEGQLFNMTIDEQEQQDAQFEDEDHEVSFRNSSQNTDDDSEGETDQESEPESENRNYSDQEQLNYESESETDKTYPEELTREERIKKLDQEMKEKIKELHALVTGSGLQETASVMQENFEGLTPSTSSQGRAKQSGLNKNINSNVGASVHKKNDKSLNKSLESPSEETIYKRAVEKQNRGSSSSEDFEIEGHDGNLNNDFDQMNLIPGPILDVAMDRYEPTAKARSGKMMMARQSPGRSATNFVGPEEKTAQILREAESAKGRILSTPGKNRNFLHTAMVDESYIVVASHVDEVTIGKIQKSEYIDFSKLIPRDRATSQDDQRLELVIRGGRSFYVPVTETPNITSYNKWEQAFRVYANIYTKVYPHRSSELIDYNHIIHTIAQSYTWENVYLYDKDFRIHMARNPECNWGLILQQAWSLRLKDRSQYTAHGNGGYSGHNTGNGMTGGDFAHKNGPCRCYNKGKCTAGTSCRYHHKCSYCFKFGHAILTCRKLMADQERNTRYKKDYNHKDRSSPRENVSHVSNN